MGHIVLLGDSIFDNASYVEGGPAVTDLLKRFAPPDWEVTLLAQDGAVAEGVGRQLANLPTNATHLIVSAGGNNALDNSAEILNGVASSFEEVLTRLSDILTVFQIEYHEMLRQVVAQGKPAFVCTIYDAVPIIGRPERTGLRLYNDVILREAIRARIPVIDLRTICTEAADYAPISPIEPSVAGGSKIARAIWHAVQRQSFPENHCWIFSNDETKINRDD